MLGYFETCKSDGSFTFDSVQNMQEAYFIVKEMHFLIQYLSNKDDSKILDGIAASVEIPIKEEVETQ